MIPIEKSKPIGLDWGTSTLRAYLFGPHAETRAQKCAPSGVMYLERFVRSGETSQPREKRFEATREDACGDWLRETAREIPVIACGMAGSTVGWKEAQYLRAPVGMDELADSLTHAQRSNGDIVHIVPGLSMGGAPHQTLPEILRGEETQVARVLCELPDGGAHGARSEDLRVERPRSGTRCAKSFRNRRGVHGFVFPRKSFVDLHGVDRARLRLRGFANERGRPLTGGWPQ
jgi:2-dehydro-3-deoxygalactonokinase